MTNSIQQRGMALISAMLLLLVLTIMAAAMFHSYGLEERTAGNTREKQRAVHAAETAQTYAEWWLSQAPGDHAGNGAQCNSLTQTPQVCSNLLPTPATLPWKAGVSYTPPMLQVAAAGTLDGYYAPPGYYIYLLANAYEPTTGTQTHTYQVDGQGYGGTSSAAAVVESSYAVSVTYSTHKDKTKFINVGGP